MFELGFQSFAPANTKSSIFEHVKSVTKLARDNSEAFLPEAIDKFQTKTTPAYKDVFERVKAKIRGGGDRER